MELKQIKELMAAMEKAGMGRLRLKEKDFEIELERKESAPPAPQPVIYHPHPEPHKFPSHATPPYKGHHAEEHHKPEEKKTEASGKFITSPMVGTMYTAASPEDAAFVKVGDKVDENTVVCIVEAMKVMNEVKAGVSGTIAEILVQNAHPVEFGSKLFRIT
ncbi:MAG: acetyl-CoA carboxylase biotin carboxyl carrier protein [Verrucomicrobia bacterium]|nr:acetyl-CoA carboxylase biotin carboxyl carrier protein [Verrucomicrobiota bacterium]